MGTAPCRFPVPLGLIFERALHQRQAPTRLIYGDYDGSHARAPPPLLNPGEHRGAACREQYAITCAKAEATARQIEAGVAQFLRVVKIDT